MGASETAACAGAIRIQRSASGVWASAVMASKYSPQRETEEGERLPAVGANSEALQPPLQRREVFARLNLRDRAESRQQQFAAAQRRLEGDFAGPERR